MNVTPTIPSRTPWGFQGWKWPADVPNAVDNASIERAYRAGRLDSDETPWALDATQYTIKARNLDIPCVAIGSPRAHPVLLVHGLSHDMWDFCLMAQQRPSSLCFWAIDLPGFGLSPKPDAEYTMAYLAEAIQAACERIIEVHGRAPVIAASSLGGHASLILAMRQPKIAAGLFLLDSGGIFHVPIHMQRIFRHYYSVDALVNRSEREVMDTAYRLFYSRDRSVVAQRLAARKLAVHRSSWSRAFALAAARIVDDVFYHPVIDHIERITTPTTFVFGSHDTVVDPRFGAIAAAKMRAPFHLVRDTGHVPMLEKPEETMELLLQFCASVGYR